MAEDVVARYRLEVQQAVGALNQVAATSDKTAKTTEDAFSKMGNSISNQFKGLASAAAAAFTLDKLIDYGTEAVKLAGKVEGVRIAFNRIGDGKMLQGLRDATKGTVSDLNLMTAAVRASNFQIPLEQMGTLLEFARRRAKETGEDINYLVESIVVGIGRKSPLILDNLGISAVELRKRFNGISIEAANVGDIAKIVGDIATEELRKMGDEALTSADKTARYQASVQNLEAAFGALFATMVGDRAEITASQIDVLLTKEIGGFEKLRLIMAATRGEMGQVTAALANAAKKTEDLANARKKVLLTPLSEEEKAMSDIAEKALRQAELNNQQVNKRIRNVAFLTEAIKALKEEQDGEATSIDRVKAITQEIIPLQAELDALLGKQKAKVKENSKAWEEWLAQVDAFNQGIEKYRDLQLEKIDNTADIERLIALRTYTDKETLAKRFFNIEQQRLQDRIGLLKQFGRDSISEQITLEQNKINEAEASWAILEDGYKRFLEGQESDYEASLKKRQEQQQAFIDWEEEQRQEQLDLFNATSSAILQISTAASQYQLALAEQRYSDIDRLVKQGVITEEEADRRRRRLAREQAKQNKEMAIFQAIIGTATAVVNALATAPNFIVGAIMAAAAGIAGGIEIATIEAQPLPQFKKGGWVDGKKHTQGGVHIEAEGGEYIINARSATRYAKLLEDINRDRLDLSGWAGLDRSLTLNNMGGNSWTDRNLLSAIDRHREGETSLLRDLLHEVKRANGRPLRGGYNA